jgi:hypothetical protein
MRSALTLRQYKVLMAAFPQASAEQFSSFLQAALGNKVTETGRVSNGDDITETVPTPSDFSELVLEPIPDDFGYRCLKLCGTRFAPSARRTKGQLERARDR